jgi:hypothetical protein
MTENTNVAEFIEIRQHIESLASQIVVSAQQKEGPRSKKKLDEANELLARLTSLANNDVQDIAVGRLTRQLAGLGVKVEALVAKKGVTKKAAASVKPSTTT